MLFSGASPTQALMMFSSIALCFARAFTTSVPGGTRGALVR
uniref:Lpa1 n=1 Tax=Arundo donax TaxID=35708 RepID=A0A0A9FML6_ARUDO